MVILGCIDPAHSKIGQSGMNPIKRDRRCSGSHKVTNILMKSKLEQMQVI